jgi:4-amino-4-deoxy-L-arabinose transferase-like glycosyltransferase
MALYWTTMSNLETDKGKSRSWLAWIVVLVLVGVALALRWRYIREISLFVDEFVTTWAARNVLARGLPIFPSGNLYPHGLTFTYLEAPFVLGKFNETVARIPGLIVSLAGIPVAYWVGRRMFSGRVGLVAAAAMAVDPDFIIWGGRARMYGLLQLLTLLVVYLFYRGMAEDRPRDRYLAMGVLVLAIFTHLEAAFLLPALGLAALVALPWRRLFRRNVVLPFAIGAVGAIAFFVIAQKGQPGHLEIMEREGRSYLNFASDLLGGPQAFAPVFTNPHRLLFTILAVGGLYFLFRPRFDRRSPLTYLYVVFTSVVALLILLANETWQRERYLFLVLPLLFLIGGEVLSRLLNLVPALRRPRAWQTALLAALVALFVGLTGAPMAYVQEWGYDLAFRTLRDQYQPAPGDRIVTSMCTAAMLYLGQCDAFAIQQG